MFIVVLMTKPTSSNYSHIWVRVLYFIELCWLFSMYSRKKNNTEKEKKFILSSKGNNKRTKFDTRPPATTTTTCSRLWKCLVRLCLCFARPPTNIKYKKLFRSFLTRFFVGRKFSKKWIKIFLTFSELIKNEFLKIKRVESDDGTDGKFLTPPPTYCDSVRSIFALFWQIFTYLLTIRQVLWAPRASFSPLPST